MGAGAARTRLGPRTKVQWNSGLEVADRGPIVRTDQGEPPMNFVPHTIVAGLAALSLGVCASPALAKGGGDLNNTVVSISPDAPALTTTSGSGSGSGGSGSRNKPSQC